MLLRDVRCAVCCRHILPAAPAKARAVQWFLGASAVQSSKVFIHTHIQVDLPPPISCRQQSFSSSSAITAINRRRFVFGGTNGDDGTAVAIVNGASIPESRLASYASAAQVAGGLQGEQRLAIGMREELREQLIIAEQTVLGRAYITRFLDDNPITEADIDALYESLTQGADASEYNVAHILVDDEGQANALLAQVLAAPDSFGEVAAENSKDPGSAQNGGNIGWIAPGSLVPPFAEAMQKTPKGKIYPEVVQTNFGWHIILVEDIRAASIPPLDDQLRGQLRQQAQAQKVQAHLQELADAATIERLEQ